MNILKSIEGSRHAQEKAQGGRNGKSPSPSDFVDASPCDKSTCHVTDDPTQNDTKPDTPQTTKKGPYCGPRPDTPCPICGSPIFWTSKYEADIFRCMSCKAAKPPAKNLIREIFDLDRDAGEPNPLAVTRDCDKLPDWQFVWANDWRRPGIRQTLPQDRPRCPHCDAAIATRSDFTKRAIKPVRGNWARGDCARCGKTIWPLINLMPGEVPDG